jgi:hypothetical protein
MITAQRALLDVLNNVTSKPILNIVMELLADKGSDNWGWDLHCQVERRANRRTQLIPLALEYFPNERVGQTSSITLPVQGRVYYDTYYGNHGGASRFV